MNNGKIDFEFEGGDGLKGSEEAGIDVGRLGDQRGMRWHPARGQQHAVGAKFGADAGIANTDRPDDPVQHVGFVFGRLLAGSEARNAAQLAVRNRQVVDDADVDLALGMRDDDGQRRTLQAAQGDNAALLALAQARKAEDDELGDLA